MHASDWKFRPIKCASAECTKFIFFNQGIQRHCYREVKNRKGLVKSFRWATFRGSCVVNAANRLPVLHIRLHGN